MPRGKEATRPLGDNGNTNPCSWNRFLLHQLEQICVRCKSIHCIQCIARSNQTKSNCLSIFFVFHTFAIILAQLKNLMLTKKSSDVLARCLWLLNASDFWLVDTLGWVSDWSEQFVHQTWNKNFVVYYASWKLNMEQTMCDWSVVRSGACFGRRWKPVCDTAPLFGLDWYPRLSRDRDFSDTNSSFHTQFSRCCVPAWANCRKTCLFYLYL